VYVTRCALDKLGIAEAIMVGHSMGGGMVAEFAARYPEYTTAAILIDAAAGQQHHEAVQMALTPDGLLRAAALITSALRDIVGDTRLAAQSRSVTELLSLGRNVRKSMSGGARIAKAGIALLRHDTTYALHMMKVWGVPTVVLHGSDDRIISERAAYQAACESGGKLVILLGHNHSWMIADPARAATHIAREARRCVRKIA
jgi:pimeloyl-ACP methyl ester carboxylesterase